MTRIALFFFLLAPALLQSADIQGIIRDAQTGNALSDVNIRVLNSAMGSISRSDGHFSLHGIDSTQFVLRFECIGYKAQTDTVDIYSNTLDFLEVE